ncbi:MAG: translation initiation factor IF-2 [Rhodopirellula sp.]|nr:translation initiation factor IF-2 [Rhodopirellula sp.]
MAVRIYSLAKQLKIDSKALVDICGKLGMTGKGSALASLSDEEVAQIKAKLSGAKTGAPGVPAGERAESGIASAAETSVLRREDYISPPASGAKKVPVLGKKPAAKSAQAPPSESIESVPYPLEQEPELAEPVQPEVVEVIEANQVIDEEKPTIQTRQPPEFKPPREIRQLRPIREIRPMREIKNLRDSKEAAKEPREPREKDKGSPAIKLAPMPAAPPPPAVTKPAEPAPQKPDIKLPADAIRASKAGGKPLSEHLRKQEEKKRERQAGGKKPAAKEKDREAADTTDVAAAGKERGRRGKAPRGAGQEDSEVTLGGREQRQLKRKRTATVRRRSDTDEDDRGSSRQSRRFRRVGTNTAAPRKSNVVMHLPCTVKSFSEALGIPAQQVLGRLLALGTVTTINSGLDAETAELLATELGVEVNFRQEVSREEKLLAEMSREDDPDALEPRAPVITFLGHVDHGKTSLLDKVLGIDVVSSEKGGITQHIRAYRIERAGGPIAFVDTPGHEAFTAMRARGANCTDIAVLVVAADDGIMPQTEEAISHAKAAGVPIVVAMNKIDLPGANPDRVMQQLAANELLPSEWGGETEVVRTSAVTGEGIDNLLETVLTVAELREYSANPNRAATGICLESEVQQGRGVVAKVLVQKGSLKVGDVIVCGAAHGRVKAMYNTLNPYKKHKEAGPSTPVNLTGLDVAPAAGDRFYVLDDISEARQIAETRASQNRRLELSDTRTHVTLENLFERLGERDEVQTLNIILRADVRGSIEAIKKELTKLEHREVQVKILQATVGGITEADVHLADASDAIIIGFSVVPDEGARTLAERTGVQVRRYDIIYQITEDLKAALEGMLRPERREADLGRALVQRTFHISRIGTVAGCRVLSGHILRDSRIRVIRENRVIGDYPLDSLKREKDDARDVREGLECGIKLSGFNDLKEGDILEAYKIEEIARTF